MNEKAAEEPKTTCSVEDCKNESAGEVPMWQKPPMALKGDEPLVMKMVPMCAEHVAEHEAKGAEAFSKEHPLKLAL